MLATQDLVVNIEGESIQRFLILNKDLIEQVVSTVRPHGLKKVITPPATPVTEKRGRHQEESTSRKRRAVSAVENDGRTGKIPLLILYFIYV